MGDVWQAMHDAARLKWWPSRAETRDNEQTAERRRDRAARARSRVRGRTHT